MEISKLINNVGSTAAPFQIPDQDNYTKDSVTRLVVESSKHLKNHLMKTIYINKLQPEYKEYALSKDQANFQEVNNLAVVEPAVVAELVRASISRRFNLYSKVEGSNPGIGIYF